MTRIHEDIKQTRPFASPTQEAAVSLMRTSDMVRRVIGSVVEPHDITIQQYNVLRILRGAGEQGLPTLDIVERLIEDAPGITRLIDRLEAKQLVSRKRCTNDRRIVYCRITAEGLALLKNLDEPVLAADRIALASLTTEEVEHLIALLDKTRNALSIHFNHEQHQRRRI